MWVETVFLLIQSNFSLFTVTYLSFEYKEAYSLKRDKFAVYLTPLIRHSRTPRQPILCAGQVTRHFSSIEFKSHGYCHSLIQHAMQIPLNICLLATKLAQYFFRNLCCVPFSDDIHAFFQLSLSQGRTQQMR